MDETGDATAHGEGTVRDHGGGPGRVVVSGVAGSGKSAVGQALARRLHVRFLEGDDFHPPANVAKMSSGHPLTDDDRWPWLAAVAQAIRAETDVVVTCSALKRSYRDFLRGPGGVRFLLLDVDRGEAERRLRERTGHYMGSAMVASQFDALERPAPEETDVTTIDARRDVTSTVASAERALRRHPPGMA